MAEALPDNMLSLPGPVTIDCGGDKAEAMEINNMPPPSTEILFVNRAHNRNQMWFIQRYEGGKEYTIHNYGTGYYACHNGHTQLSLVLDPTTCLWYVERAGEGEYKILVPNKDLVWTVNESTTPKALTLKPANGSAAQRFKFGFGP